MAAQVELSFVRRNSWPAGVRAHVLWNGAVAANGDGEPNASPTDPPDEATPLTPAPIDLWPAGKCGDGAERDGEGVDGWPESWLPGYGDGDGIDGSGEDGVYGDTLTWSTARVLPALRDGQYRFAVRLESAEGNVQTDSLYAPGIILTGVPRPPRDLSFDGWSGGQLQLSWTRSADV